ncbi:hypothetical protein [Hydrogenophaga sp. BPS33]|uniref:hypothetical protein n=1 Tax=Hydrogenophaga sp. BPS33 TaxID=2651974 RepID=UPI00131FC8C6|nr:hypothetical protein [Hydrogenophaga sp. BPS33]QHE86504.1 hypothetical protein F9K07_17155 [Hydrogenophaga sp. BPS33]
MAASSKNTRIALPRREWPAHTMQVDPRLTGDFHIEEILFGCRCFRPRSFSRWASNTADHGDPLIGRRKNSLRFLIIGNTINQMENSKPSGRGGSRPGAGRKPKEQSEAMDPVSIKMTGPQRDKLKRLGGAPWVREKIDKAKEPKE